jgi:hypothetical protein
MLKFQKKTKRNRITAKRKKKNKNEKSEKKEKKMSRPIHHAWVCGGWATPTRVVYRHPP